MSFLKKINKMFFTFGKEDLSLKQIFFNFLLIFIPPIYFYPFRLLRNLIFKFQGIKLIISQVFIKQGCIFDFPKNISLGKNVFINRNVIFEGKGKIKIGNNVQIGPNTIFLTTSHDITKNHMAISKNANIYDNTWIGASVTIVPGITIGPNVIVGAGSVVTKNFSNCKIVGNPAKIIN